MVVTFPRIILAEFNTHRMFSRNSASSRAIPFEHCAQCVASDDTEFAEMDKKGDLWSGNFKAFVQYRKTLPNENITK